MNERIKKLADQAKTETNNHFEGQRMDWVDWEKVYDAKFAELIIRECMSITDKCSTGPAIYDLFADQIIAEHFGVEE